MIKTFTQNLKFNLLAQASIKNSRQGNILIESIVSISLILIGLLGVFGLITHSVRQNKDVNLRTTASYLAAEGIEVMKNIVDTDVVSKEVPWNATVGSNTFETYEIQYDSDNNPEFSPIPLGGASSSTPLVIDNETGLYGYSNGGDETQTPFFRTVSISVPETNPDEMHVVSEVLWQERSGSRTVRLETIFMNWRND